MGLLPSLLWASILETNTSVLSTPRRHFIGGMASLEFALPRGSSQISPGSKSGVYDWVHNCPGTALMAPPLLGICGQLTVSVGGIYASSVV